MNKLLLVAAMCLAVGCKKEKKCAVSVGSCTSPQATQCGVGLACGDRQLEIKCTPPADQSAKQMDCQCVENGVIGKAVQLEYPLNAPSAEALARTACDWK